MTVEEYEKRLEFRSQRLEVVREQLCRTQPGDPHRAQVQRLFEGLSFQHDLELRLLARLRRYL